MAKVMIASPVRQKDAILREFLWSLDQLDTSGLEIRYVFIDDNETPSPLLAEFAAKHGEDAQIVRGSPTGEYHCNEQTHLWQEDLIWKVAGYKDQLITIAKESACDFLFLVDSDLVLPPETLAHLISLDKDIVSTVFWTKWAPELAALPQVWLRGQYEMCRKQRGEVLGPEEAAVRQHEFLAMLRTPGTYKVGGLGACTLISRKALTAGVAFAEIYNSELIGEDRHFCLRAAALGFELFADTHCEPFHLYRDSDLPELHQYKLRHFGAYRPPKPRLTLAMLVKNEAGRYLEQVLEHAARYVDRAVILDDASTDDTVAICEKCLAGIEHIIVTNPSPLFANEIVLRRQLWDLAAAGKPDWVLILDADEIFEDAIIRHIRELIANPYVDVYNFRLYDMWAENRFREDGCWQAHQFYRPFLVRYRPGFPYEWQETPQHCGRFPRNIAGLRSANSPVRLKHLGWMKPADRLAKYLRYKQLDPQYKYGIKEQYLSILDPLPTLRPWEP